MLSLILLICSTSSAENLKSGRGSKPRMWCWAKGPPFELAAPRVFSSATSDALINVSKAKPTEHGATLHQIDQNNANLCNGAHASHARTSGSPGRDPHSQEGIPSGSPGRDARRWSRYSNFVVKHLLGECGDVRERHDEAPVQATR